MSDLRRAALHAATYGVGDPDCAKTGFGNLHYIYPTLYNASGTATGVVAANDFYIYGDHPFGNYQQKLLHLCVTNVPAP